MYRGAKKKLNGLVMAGFFAAAVLLSFAPSAASAAHGCDPATQQEISIAIQDPNDPTGQTMTNCVPKSSTTISGNPIIGLLRTLIQFLAAGIGIALAGGIIFGGIVYMTARANPQQVQKAEEIIRNAIIGIALYVFMFAILNFLIPGGILN